MIDSKLTDKEKIEVDRRLLAQRVGDLLFEAHVPMDQLEVIVHMVKDAVKEPVAIHGIGWVDGVKH